jgi:histidinol-phosphate phosphatase family protein
VSFSIVVPTIGRPSLFALLESLGASDGVRPDEIVLVDDRREATDELVPDAIAGWPGEIVRVQRSGGRGPAVARNVGWRAVTADWVVFLDDDVQVTESWLRDLRTDLAECEADARIAGTQARLQVPLPDDRRPTDWERGTAGLERAAWITADMAFRRDVLDLVGGFDERFPRAFREDADIALRIQDAGFRIDTGRRVTVHPVRPAPWWASVGHQRGNADDVLMRALHGRRWRQRVYERVGRRHRHLVISAAAVAAVAFAVLRRPMRAAVACAVWLLGTGEFAYARIAPGPRTGGEIARMLVTSVAIPPVATWHWLRGIVRHRNVRPWQANSAVRAVLVDRDGTIVQDVPYNGDPDRVEPMPGARDALDRLRSAGLHVGVVTNQSGVGTGRITPEQVKAVNERVEQLLGPFATWQVCPHSPDDGCDCRKPNPGMVVAAASALGVEPRNCVVIGDTGADVAAGLAAGARAVLMPNDVTRREEVELAPVVVDGWRAATATVLGFAGVRS